MSFWTRILIGVIVFHLGSFTYAQEFNRNLFFAALSMGDTLKINEQLKKINRAYIPDQQAYTGVLLMRKAEFVKGVKKKLDLFKEGGRKLEDAIVKNKSNAEYRFLRLLIQENAPGLLRYNDNIQEDAKMVKDYYTQLNVDTQKAVLDYCKKSKVLKPEDFKNVKHE